MEHNKCLRIDNSFSVLDLDTQSDIQDLLSQVHYRNGYKYPDGSIGEIRISPKELKDSLATIVLKERSKYRRAYGY